MKYVLKEDTVRLDHMNRGLAHQVRSRKHLAKLMRATVLFALLDFIALDQTRTLSLVPVWLVVTVTPVPTMNAKNLVPLDTFVQKSLLTLPNVQEVPINPKIAKNFVFHVHQGFNVQT